MWQYPCLIDADGHCPPEDVGGPWGYAEFLEAINDPNHERHSEFSEWVGQPFDPSSVNAEKLAHAVEKLAKQGTRKPAVNRKRTN